MGLAIVFGLGLVVSVSGGGDRQAAARGGEYAEAGPMAIPAIGDEAEVEEEETMAH
jgi:hypothetical protein